MSFQFPRTHLLALAIICGALALLSFVETTDSLTGLEAQTSNSRTHPAAETSTDATLPANLPVGLLPISNTPGQDRTKVIEHTIRRGDSLALVFSRYGFHPADLHRIASIKPEGNSLRSILPGKRLKFYVDDNGALVRFSYAASPLEIVEFERNKTGGFMGNVISREPEKNAVYRFGRIDQSLFSSAQRGGLSDALIMELAKIFQWDIDFALDLRQGDEFSLILEDLYLDDQFIGHGNILAAEFVNQGEVFRAVRYETDQYGGGYYLPNGKSLRKAFLRAPLEFSRISSNFNPARIHPLFNRAMPHRGIDYAAPTGTPIRASGSGRVQIAGKSPANGNYVFIQHNAEYQTKYLHLSRFAKGIRAGSRVRQGDVIGYVGATGWATAPHLHYEFLIGGVHQNPRTVKLPNDAPLEGEEMLAFHAHAKPLLFQLDAYRQGPQVAAAQ